jgi:hypothetical protein
VQLLVHAEYAALISRDFSMRAKYLEEIASLHTRRNLLSHVKIGPKTVADIEKWLASKGRRLRRSDEDLSAVICSFKVKRHAPADEGSHCLSRTVTVQGRFRTVENNDGSSAAPPSVALHSECHSIVTNVFRLDHKIAGRS